MVRKIVKAKSQKCPVCHRAVSGKVTGNVLLYKDYDEQHGNQIVENVWVHRKCVPGINWEEAYR